MLESVFRGRFAPTPSGALHMGNLRTALAAYCQAAQHDGSFLLRFDDLDEPRVKPGKIQEHQHDLAFLGITFTEPPFFQSERKSLYQTAFDQLRHAEAIYPCFCTRREIQQANEAAENPNTYPGTCRSVPRKQALERVSKGEHHCWRFRLPAPRERLDDAVMGLQEVDLEREGGDFVILRADGQFSYQLSCAVDDAQPGITHVLRGQDLLVSAARQQLVMKALSLAPPQYGHLPLLESPDGRKLSKSDGDDDLRAFLAKGCSKEEILSALAVSLGLAEPGERISLETCVRRFPQTVAALKPRPFPIV